MRAGETPAVAEIGGKGTGAGMRKVLGVVLLIAAAIGGLWIGGESWAAGRLRELIAERPDMQAAAVRPLREPARIGLRLDRPQLAAPGFGLAPDWLELWLSPLAPLRAVAVPSASGRLDLSGQQVPFQIADARAQVALSPLNRMAVSHLAVDSGAVLLGEQVLMQRLRAEADLVRLGAGAPPAAGAAYDLRLALEGLQGDRLAVLGFAPLALPGALSAEGAGRVWLEGALGGLGGGAAPRVVGVQTGGLELRLGALSARLVGQLVQGADGLTEGRVALYTSDGQGFLDAAADAGLIPADGRLLARAMLNQMGRMPMPEPAAPDGLDFPEPAAGELRIPLILRDGRLLLGEMPIGPAPAFPG